MPSLRSSPNFILEGELSSTHHCSHVEVAIPEFYSGLLATTGCLAGSGAGLEAPELTPPVISLMHVSAPPLRGHQGVQCGLDGVTHCELKPLSSPSLPPCGHFSLSPSLALEWALARRDCATASRHTRSLLLGLQRRRLLGGSVVGARPPFCTSTQHDGNLVSLSLVVPDGGVVAASLRRREQSS